MGFALGTIQVDTVCWSGRGRVAMKMAVRKARRAGLLGALALVGPVAAETTLAAEDFGQRLQATENEAKIEGGGER